MGRWFHSKKKEAEAEAKAAASEVPALEETAEPEQPPSYAFVQAEGPEKPHILDHPGNFELRYPGYSQSAVSFASGGNFEAAIVGDVGYDLREVFGRSLVGASRLQKFSHNIKQLQIGQHAFELGFAGPEQESKQTEVHQIRSSDAVIVLFDPRSPKSFEAARATLSLIAQNKGDDLAWHVAPRLPPVVLYAVVSSHSADRLRVPYAEFKAAAAEFRSALYVMDRHDEDSARLIADDMVENLVARLEIARQIRMQETEPGKDDSDTAFRPPIYGSAPPMYDMLAPSRSSGRTLNILLGGDIFEFLKRSIAQTFRDKESLSRQYEFSRTVAVYDKEWHVRLLGSYGTPLGRSGWRQYLDVADAFIIVCGISDFQQSQNTVTGFYNDIVNAKQKEWKDSLESFHHKPIGIIGMSILHAVTPFTEREFTAMAHVLGCVWSSMHADRPEEVESTMEEMAKSLIRRSGIGNRK